MSCGSTPTHVTCRSGRAASRSWSWTCSAGLWVVAWVRGVQLDERTGMPVRERTLRVPIDQCRAVYTERAVGRVVPAGGTDAVVIGPPKGYRRRDIAADGR